MKSFLLAIAAAGLTGCAVYPADPAYGAYGTYGAYGPTSVAPYYVEPPIYLHGAGFYRHHAYPPPHVVPRPYLHPMGHHRLHPGGVPDHGPRPQLNSPRPGHGARDRHRDGASNPIDRPQFDGGR